MRIFSNEHMNPMFWDEYGAAVEALAGKICQSKLSFNALVPIMRSGAIPGNMLAIRFQITNIIPLQFKYLSDPSRPQQLNRIPGWQAADRLTILICENNTSTGNTARAAIALLQQLFPNSRLHYATVAKVFGGPDSFEGVGGYYFGVQTNERFLASPAQMKALSSRPGITLFPWEVAEHELAEVNNCQRNASNQFAGANAGARRPGPSFNRTSRAARLKLGLKRYVHRIK